MTTEEAVRYLLIEPDGSITVKNDVLSTESVQEWVGGAFEVLPTPTDIPVTILVAEDAKRKGENANWAVTRLIRSRLRPDDFVAGRGLVTGVPNEAGNPTDITPEVEKAIREKVEVK